MKTGILKSALTALFLCFAALPSHAESVTFGSAKVSIETSGGGSHALDVEFAATPAQRARGLMERTKLDPDSGMIFDFGVERDVMMWMKDTPLPLDMLFVATDGTVTRIAEKTEPYSETIIPSHGPVRYVLEINGGRAAELGISAGDHLSLTDVKQP